MNQDKKTYTWVELLEMAISYQMELPKTEIARVSGFLEFIKKPVNQEASL